MVQGSSFDPQARIKELREASLTIMRMFYKDEFSRLEENEREFVLCFQEIFTDIKRSIVQSKNPFASAYEFSETLKAAEKALRLYNHNLYVMRCIKEWSDPYTDMMKYDLN